ncbi:MULTISPECIES: DMT family transporter [Bradyrhizobium]|jgi:drug/metabolite transporter (DMT)-like permease|uniref:DMT family transporter n=1 Tax=Bradyrhizobium TaxID=374 RepID=UPI00047F72F4|nr:MULTISPECIES: DMT family transporter [Bradyrhizobium]MCS3448864.1 drug/metabolite transporter (DMT)-like permease [Bradyrhizobium elkanii]MCS3559992.1 drug/metabolite transporter (DMT)-like permease [Bradyrhizobium elkanii]MCW2150161.1 drug/metabolite transporter (DMT)-like permease [Bradyrhizobium elkanii]MCW2359780.1 drug/metabolite transporter (DMT)-like permease [Bradyrhizobium elkanii]MCW2373892.1 drug/metabolite transporter (DMT)-like permease [Bradyrhizobium elkanii]
MTALLFALTALLWGGGALATAMQAGVTPAPWSVALRMMLAGVILLGYGRLRGVPLAIPRKDRPAVALQGLLFFAIAFIAFYEATARMPSGLAALVLSTSSLFAAVIARAVLGVPISSGFVSGALCGILGLAIIFLPGAAAHRATPLAGFAWALTAAIATGAGTTVGARNQRAGLPVVSVLGWGAFVGAAASALWAVATGTPFAADISLSYVASFLYLGIAASCITFMLYFELVRRLGPGRAAYTLALVPLVALVLSALFEHLALGWPVLAGAAAILAGNVLVLARA